MEPTTPSRFPPVDQANADGLLALGGRLEPDWLLDAYRHGVFPWPEDDRSPVSWWSPNPRAVIEWDNFHASRRLRRRIVAGRFELTVNRAFSEVMVGCATAPGRDGATWITPNMIHAYTQLHEIGHAHSVETWREGRLVGGVYGVALGGAFAAESMFHLETDASKAALAHLVARLQSRGFVLLDIQQWTPHTGRMGATVVSREAFLGRLKHALTLPVTFEEP